MFCLLCKWQSVFKHPHFTRHLQKSLVSLRHADRDADRDGQKNVNVHLLPKSRTMLAKPHLMERQQYIPGIYLGKGRVHMGDHVSYHVQKSRSGAWCADNGPLSHFQGRWRGRESGGLFAPGGLWVFRSGPYLGPPCLLQAGREG
jgi:hypothetical protein